MSKDPRVQCEPIYIDSDLGSDSFLPHHRLASCLNLSCGGQPSGQLGSRELAVAGRQKRTCGRCKWPIQWQATYPRNNLCAENVDDWRQSASRLHIHNGSSWRSDCLHVMLQTRAGDVNMSAYFSISMALSNGSWKQISGLWPLRGEGPMAANAEVVIFSRSWYSDLIFCNSIMLMQSRGNGFANRSKVSHSYSTLSKEYTGVKCGQICGINQCRCSNKQFAQGAKAQWYDLEQGLGIMEKYGQRIDLLGRRR